MCAADFPAYMATVPTPHQTPPSGYTWAQVRERITAQKQDANAARCAPGGTGVQVQASALRNDFYL